MYKKLTIHKGSGNYQFNNVLISCLSNDHYIGFLNQSTNSEIGYICLNVLKDIHNKIVFPCTDNQEKIITAFINNHTQKINNKLYLINVIIDGVKIDKLNLKDLYNDKIQKTFNIEIEDGTYPNNDIIKKFNIEANNLQDCIKKIDLMKEYKDYKIMIIYEDFYKARRCKNNSWYIIKNVD